MANQQGKFTPKLAEMTQLPNPGRGVPNSLQHFWKWSRSCQNVPHSPYTIVWHQQKISADESAFGLGRVILQKVDSTWNLFHLDWKDYIVVVDYFFPLTGSQKAEDNHESECSKHSEDNVYTWYGIPQVSDQIIVHSSQEFTQFAEKYKWTSRKSCPTVKLLLKNAEYPFLT